eukprot:2133611-Rhodomonas_salina.2
MAEEDLKKWGWHEDKPEVRSFCAFSLRYPVLTEVLRLPGGSHGSRRGARSPRADGARSPQGRAPASFAARALCDAWN